VAYLVCPHPNLGPVFTTCGSRASVETAPGTNSSNSQLPSPWANIVAPTASRTKHLSWPVAPASRACKRWCRMFMVSWSTSRVSRSVIQRLSNSRRSAIHRCLTWVRFNSCSSISSLKLCLAASLRMFASVSRSYRLRLFNTCSSLVKLSIVSR